MGNDSIIYNSEHKQNKNTQKIELIKACPLSDHEEEASGRVIYFVFTSISSIYPRPYGEQDIRLLSYYCSSGIQTSPI